MVERLAWEAVHHVDVDAFNARAAQAGDGRIDGIARLDAVDTLLNVCVEHLDAKARTAEAVAGEGADDIGRKAARIGFGCNFCIAGKRKAAAERGEQPINLRRCQNVGRAAAKVQVADTGVSGEQGCDLRDFSFEGVDIAVDRVGLCRNAGVASAIPAKLLAVGDVHIQRDLGLRG